MDNVQQLFSVKREATLPIESTGDLNDLLQRVTSRVQKKLNQFTSQIKHYKTEDIRAVELQNAMNKELARWADDMRRLGAVPVNFGKCKIFTDNGMYLWEYQKQPQ